MHTETADNLSNSIMAIFDECFDVVINKIPDKIKIVNSAEKLAAEYLAKPGFLSEKVDSLINWQAFRSGLVGVSLNLGSIATLPFTLPAEFTSNLFIQMRLVAAIALMGEHNLKDDRVKTLVFCCMVGDPILTTLKQAGVEISKRSVTKLIEKIPFELILKINQTVGYRLITKSGESGIINLSKGVPAAGAAFAAMFDYSATMTFGKIAQAHFIEKDESYLDKKKNLKNITKKTAQNYQP